MAGHITLAQICIMIPLNYVMQSAAIPVPIYNKVERHCKKNGGLLIMLENVIKSLGKQSLL